MHDQFQRQSVAQSWVFCRVADDEAGYREHLLRQRQDFNELVSRPPGCAHVADTQTDRFRRQANGLCGNDGVYRALSESLTNRQSFAWSD